MLWIFLIAVAVVLPITKHILDLPTQKRAQEIQKIKALTELERVKQENYLLENTEMRKELEKIRKENQMFLNNDDSKWLINKTNLPELEKVKSPEK
ncbi:hypothetical protein [Phocicoccus pinnipedialis]|uniref:Uncharacterized protein n=1 Tax=Phocicoccus pinnipedialis TaxID=110845 RepID=A0A6V7RBD3_9BACL|nr:hypothetical protein [Jeotgalicoccus pinnipedialis]MBP1939897.1 hypothetical protein [Jeotgalicoccus pinnipedialis]CAD2074770.1 hypothetical protein JEOPIN946_00831 [Jeotgalicoccus pinnipedialis]